MSIAFLNPEGIRIAEKTAKEISAQVPNPYIIKEYLNGRVHLTLRHAMTVRDADACPRNMWKLFEVTIENIRTHDSEGVPYTEPRRSIDPDSKGFRTLDGAESHYESFLAKHTESYFEESSGEFVEQGNELTPPDPDMPTMSAESPMNSEMGSW